MNQSTYMKVAGTIFLVVAVLHLYRAVSSLPIVIGDFSVPVVASWIGVVIAGFLAYRGFLKNKGIVHLIPKRSVNIGKMLLISAGSVNLAIGIVDIKERI
jgi:hypothetical protein